MTDEISIDSIIKNLKTLLKIFKSKWKNILLFGIFGILLGLFIAIIVKPEYKAVLTFAMEEDKMSGSGLTGALGLASSFGLDIGSGGGGGAFAASNISELMKSRLIVEKVLLSEISINGQSLPLIEYYLKINSLREKWKNKPKLKNLKFYLNQDREKFSLIQDSVLREVYKKLIKKENLSITQKDKKVTILTLEVKSKNEIFSKFFCEKLAFETSNFYIQTKIKKAKTNVDVLQKQVDSVKYELNSAVRGVALEVDNVFNLNQAYNIKGSASKRRQIDVQANTAILTNLVVQLELAKITLRKETPLIQLIDKPILPLEEEEFGKLELSFIFGFIFSFFSFIYFSFRQFYSKLSF